MRSAFKFWKWLPYSITNFSLVNSEHKSIEDCWKVISLYLIALMWRHNSIYRLCNSICGCSFIKERRCLKGFLLTCLTARSFSIHSTHIGLCCSSSISKIVLCLLLYHYINTFLKRICVTDWNIMKGWGYCIPAWLFGVFIKMFFNISEIFRSFFYQTSRYVVSGASFRWIIAIMHPHLLPLIQYFLTILLCPLNFPMILFTLNWIHCDRLAWTWLMHWLKRRF